MAREPRVGEIEAPPPEVDGARLTDEAAAEHLQNPFDLDEQLPACPSRCGIVRAVDRVGFEANGAGDFDRHGPDPGADVQPCQRVHDEAIELGDRARLKRDRGVASIRALENELMRNKVKRGRDAATVGRQRKRGEPAWRYLEGGRSAERRVGKEYRSRWSPYH